MQIMIYKGLIVEKAYCGGFLRRGGVICAAIGCEMRDYYKETMGKCE